MFFILKNDPFILKGFFYWREVAPTFVAWRKCKRHNSCRPTICFPTKRAFNLAMQRHEIRRNRNQDKKNDCIIDCYSLWFSDDPGMDFPPLKPIISHWAIDPNQASHY